MAYAATVLYLAAAAWLMFTTDVDVMDPGPRKWYRATFIVIVAVAALTFVWWQLRQRRFAANLVEACTRLLTRAGGGEPPSTLVDPRVYNGILLPHFLVDELVAVAEARSFERGAGVSELITYLTMVVTAVLVGLRLIR